MFRRILGWGLPLALSFAASAYVVNYLELNRYEQEARKEVSKLERDCNDYKTTHEDRIPPVAFVVDKGKIASMHPLWYCTLEMHNRKQEIDFYRSAKFNPLKKYSANFQSVLKMTERIENGGRRDVMKLLR